ncbi:sucrose phosphorylase [Clostridiaceae bacterium HSG29]|nr:sucrose phosphorylase [Clostridiaceae bacterium HSG29]
MKNEVMLITYPDSLGKNLSELEYVLENYFKDAVKGVHVLPFYPSSADRGFAPKTYDKVDKKFGNWNDLLRISDNHTLMYDIMLNHISKSSEYFYDFIKNKDQSEFYDYFIKYSEFWPNGEPTQEQIDLIYKRKPRAPYIDVEFDDGTKEKIWCTFDEEQVDLDITKEATREFIKESIVGLCKNGAKIIRIDAFAYVTKKVDTNCFFVEPDTWEILDYVNDIAKDNGAVILPEIHEHYSIQLKLAKKGYYIYDFALPMLVLHALYSNNKENLVNWMKIAPKNQFTTLDTHDGIGVVDVKDLMSDKDVEFTKEALYSKGGSAKKIYSSEKYKNLDIYQINCTYYSALGDNDKAYLLSRAIQFFSPGIPQVYYVGLMAGKNDIELLEKTKMGRNINRHFYSLNEIENEIERPVIQSLLKLMKFRNEFKVFDGEMEIVDSNSKNELIVKWTNGEQYAILEADLETYDFEIKYFKNNSEKILML